MRSRQVEIRFPCGWGGKRKGAGRKRQHPRKRVPHTRRPRLASRFPVHVTVRLLPGLPRLRGFEAAKALRHAFVHGCDKGTFRICQFSLLGNHAHLICEAKDAAALATGMKGWKTRVTRRLNALWGGRKGTVWDDRYHATITRTPRQVRNALCYVMNNARRHREQLPAWTGGADPFSSARYFDGWRENSWRNGLAPPDDDESPVARPRTWLLSKGWRRHGMIGVGEVPSAAQGVR